VVENEAQSFAKWASKIESHYRLVEQGKKSSAEYKAMAPRIKQFFQGRP
jgi:hypothetical protein